MDGERGLVRRCTKELGVDGLPERSTVIAVRGSLDRLISCATATNTSSEQPAARTLTAGLCPDYEDLYTAGRLLEALQQTERLQDATLR
jgi:hypothetical protein